MVLPQSLRLQFAPASGGYLIATMLVGYSYSAASKAQGGDGRYCSGPECYSSTWLTLVALNSVSLAATLYLVHTTRDVYFRMAKQAAMHRRVPKS